MLSFWFDVVAFNICLLQWKTAIGGKQCFQVAFGVIIWMYNYKLMYWYLESRRWRHGGQTCKQIWSTSNWKQHFGPQLYIFFILCISFPLVKLVPLYHTGGRCLLSTARLIIEEGGLVQWERVDLQEFFKE